MVEGTGGEIRRDILHTSGFRGQMMDTVSLPQSPSRVRRRNTPLMTHIQTNWDSNLPTNNARTVRAIDDNNKGSWGTFLPRLKRRLDVTSLRPTPW